MDTNSDVEHAIEELISMVCIMIDDEPETLNKNNIKEDISEWDFSKCTDVGLNEHKPVNKQPVKVKKVKIDDCVKFAYYGCTGECNRHKGVIVVASAVNDGGKVVHYGTAFCSPKDVYDKAKGKLMAYNDLIDNNFSVSLGRKTHQEINARIIGDIIANDDAPSWARNMVATAMCRHLVNAFDVGDF